MEAKDIACLIFVAPLAVCLWVFCGICIYNMILEGTRR